MTKQLSNLTRLKAALAGRRFFRIIVAILVFQAAWIALTSRYPMAFDEDFHLGIIKLYAHHISPFWSHQPENADMFGAIARDPSYLFQYLMSFPYRLIHVFTSNLTVTVIILRFIDIGFFAAGLVLFRKLLRRTGVSDLLVNLTLLIFVLLPIVPLLAAQINYDNLLFALVPATLLMTLDFDKKLTEKNYLDVKLLILLLSLCLLTSLVMYAFLPIFAIIVAFIGYRLWQFRRQATLANFVSQWRKLIFPVQLALVAMLIIASGLFIQRIGVNLVRYHTPVPSCDKVLSVEACSEYGPWMRDYTLETNKSASSHNPLIFTGDWLYGMWLRSFFAVAGSTNDFETRGPLILPSMVIVGVAALSLIAFGVSAKRLFHRYHTPALILCLAAAAFYVLALYADEYKAYVHTGEAVAINGRYLLPVILPVMLLAGASLKMMLAHRPRITLGLTTILVVSLLWGGGALTYILRSDDTWYWDNGAARTVNKGVKKVLGPITPGYKNPIEFL